MERTTLMRRQFVGPGLGRRASLKTFLDVRVRFFPKASSSSDTGQRALIGATCTLRLNVRMPCPDG